LPTVCTIYPGAGTAPISLNCAALNENLLDTELFGHEAGAFTGAQKRHPGRFERADGGTLFLDELATAPMLVQEKLLRVIEYGELERVGGSQPLQVNVRLVCATNANLPERVAEEKFRADLLDRLAFDVVQLPPCASEEATSCCWQTSLRFRCAASSACRCSPASAIMQRRRCWLTTGREISAN
jgi:transcriptional regulator of acetoin/glycerol metabolism